MADSNPQWQGRTAKIPSPPNTNSPLSPASASSNPINFRTNVNRAKTKRWVEAKQYSYDGGEWGDEDDEEEPPVAPHPPYATHRTGSSSELSSRRLSGLAPGSEESRVSPSAEAQQNSSGDQTAPSFIRPADIYKRMREGRSSADSGRAAEAPPSSEQSGGSSMPAVTSSSTVPRSESSNAPLMGLPEVKRISGFGTDFLGGGDSSYQQPTASESQESSLHHNPSEASSQGFRSVVHQAFDVPETPNSTAGSVERSNSDGTSTLSPIMSSRGWMDDKTPTIPEEPAESNTPTGTSEAPFFKPGHRRDFSLPSSDNSPSKRPVVTDHDIPASGHAEISSVPPSGQNYDQSGSMERSSDAGSSSKRASMLPPGDPAKGDFVAPLKLGSNGTHGAEGYRGDIPTIVPGASAGTSPQDADNDRLREEIIRSLSREGSQEPDQQPQSQGAKDESIPHQFEKYWDNGATPTGPNFGEVPRPLVSESHPDWTSSHPLGSQDPYAAGQSTNGGAPPATSEPTAKPKMARRFSWESSSSNEEPVSQVTGGLAPHPPLSAALAAQQPEPIHDGMEGVSREPPMTDDEASDGQKVEKPRLSIVPPVAENGSPPEQIAGPVDVLPAQRDPVLAKIGTSDIDETQLKSFREILTITVPAERIRAFDHTRDQFAFLNTGLNQWLQSTVHDHPEHADLVQASQTLSADFPRSSPTSRRFPKLTSLGNLTARDEGTPASAGHNRRPSGHIGTIVNRPNVGKDLLHTAGTFGGKAGEAAKGLFAKGRSKFRPSGDKGQSTSSRKSSQFQFSFSPDPNGSHGNSSFRNSVSFGGLPIFKSGRNESSAAVHSGGQDTSFLKPWGDKEPAGKRFKASESLDLLRSQNNVGDNATNRHKSQGFVGQSEVATDFEREMNLALGLSLTESRNGLMDSTNDTVPMNDQVEISTDNQTGTEKSLPLLPVSPQSPDMAASSGQPGLDPPDATTSSIRPVLADEAKPSTPPKDLPPKDFLPGVPPKDLPPKDLPPRDFSLQNFALKDLAPFPHSSHSQRHPSVSTLGADERMASQEVETPPSPIQAPAAETENPVYDKPLPRATASGTSLPSVEEDSTGFTAMQPRRQSSAQILETKRRSISGMPGIQSPLRNEVRYSPGTRSSILSFGSFGRHSTNSRGTRPGTPANELRAAEPGSPAPNADSKMDKLKSFGKRRRASVGDLLSGIQGNIQGGLQDLPEGSKRKRTFSRISGLFSRSNEARPAESNQGDRVEATEASESKALPDLPSNGNTRSSAEIQNASFTDKVLPAMPAVESKQTPATHEPRQRASMSLPPSASFNSMTSGRFYSQIQSGGTLSSAQHTRSQSQPLMFATPLSPIAPSESDKSGSPSPPAHEVKEDGSEKKQESRLPQDQPLSSKQQEPDQTGQAPHIEQLPGQSDPQLHEHTEATDRYQPTPSPEPSLNSRRPAPNQPETSTATKTAPRNISISATSSLSRHPHRNEARSLNETGEPVELAMTKDDSSEEIVMSPTAYPGQEWTPMHM